MSDQHGERDKTKGAESAAPCLCQEPAKLRCGDFSGTAGALQLSPVSQKGLYLSLKTLCPPWLTDRAEHWPSLGKLTPQGGQSPALFF